MEKEGAAEAADVEKEGAVSADSKVTVLDTDVPMYDVPSTSFGTITAKDVSEI